MKKKFTLVAAMCCLVSGAFAEVTTTNEKIGDLWYGLDSDGTATVLRQADAGNLGANPIFENEVKIPLEVMGADTKTYKVDALAKQVFNTATFKNGLTFELNTEGMSNLTRFDGPGAFNGVKELKELILPEGITNFSNNLIQEASIEILVLPNSMDANPVLSSGRTGLTKLRRVTVGAATDTLASNFANNCDFLEVIEFTHTEKAPVWYVDADKPLSLTADRTKIKIIVADGTKDLYVGAFWEGFGGIYEKKDDPGMGDASTLDTFEADGFKWAVTNKSAYEVEVATSPTMQGEDGSTYEVSAYDAETITIPNEVTGTDGKKYKVIGYGNRAFYGCRLMTSIVHPTGLKIINNGAFGDNKGLTLLEIPEGVTSIGSWVTQSSTIEEVMLPGTISTIAYTFGNSPKLKKVTLGTGITNLGASTMLNCPLLETIVLKRAETATTFIETAFRDTPTANVTVVVPEGKADLYVAAGWTYGDGGIFKAVTDNATTSIENIEMGEVFVQRGAVLTFHKEESIQIMNVTGQTLYSGVTAAYELPQVGVYIVRTAKGCYKVKL